eukprot:110086-Karenia_brevis.AAC.1
MAVYISNTMLAADVGQLAIANITAQLKSNVKPRSFEKLACTSKALTGISFDAVNDFYVHAEEYERSRHSAPIAASTSTYSSCLSPPLPSPSRAAGTTQTSGPCAPSLDCNLPNSLDAAI